MKLIRRCIKLTFTCLPIIKKLMWNSILKVICICFIKNAACVLFISDWITSYWSFQGIKINIIVLQSAHMKCWLTWYLGKKISNILAVFFLNLMLRLDLAVMSKVAQNKEFLKSFEHEQLHKRDSDCPSHLFSNLCCFIPWYHNNYLWSCIINVQCNYSPQKPFS